VTTPEDRLRQILQTEADDVVPAGDGLRQIEQRLADRRSLRSKLVPALAIAGVVAIAGAAAITVSVTDDGSLQHSKKPPAISPEPSACAGGLCTEPIPSPSMSTSDVTTSSSGLPVWPFTTDAQAAAWERTPGSRTWAADPVQVVTHLMSDYLKLPGQATRRVDSDPDAAIVEVSAAGRPVSQVRLVKVGRDANGPWSVTGASSDNLSVTQPNDGDEVSSPLAVAGRVSGVDQSVHLRLMTTAVLAEAFAPAGMDLPWTQSLTWTESEWSVAALAANTFNGKGDLSAVTITAVRRTGAVTPGIPAAGTVFVALDQERVVTVDALTGKRLRQISYPPPGAVDLNPDRGGQDGVVWVRVLADNCTTSILRAGLVNGPAGVTVEAKPIGRNLPSLSAGGRSLAWVERPCTGGPSTVVVRGPDAKFVTTATSAQPLHELDVRDDGYAVAQLDDGVVVLPPGVADVTAGRRLVADTNCTLSAPAWDGNEIVAWEECLATDWVLGRWSASGKRVSGSVVVSGMSRLSHTAVDNGQVLVSLDNHRLARLSQGTLVDIPNAYRWGQPDW
jgi:hypothetical protein